MPEIKLREISESLEKVARSVKDAPDPSRTGQAIQNARVLIGAYFAGRGRVASLEKLDSELGIWESKLAVILREPAGRQGIAKHVNHWVEELRKLNVG